MTGTVRISYALQFVERVDMPTDHPMRYARRAAADWSPPDGDPTNVLEELGMLCQAIRDGRVYVQHISTEALDVGVLA